MKMEHENAYRDLSRVYRFFKLCFFLTNCLENYKCSKIIISKYSCCSLFFLQRQQAKHRVQKSLRQQQAMNQSLYSSLSHKTKIAQQPKQQQQQTTSASPQFQRQFNRLQKDFDKMRSGYYDY